LLLLLACIACGAGTNPGAPTDTPTAVVAPSSSSSLRAAVSIAVSPSPVISIPADSRAPRQASWQIVLRETGGVGASVNFVNATLRDAATGVLADPNGVLSQSSSDILAAAGSNHLAASGSLAVPQTVTFALASGAAAPGRLEVTVQLTDDHGNVIGAATTASVE
jgi:hypothetical protein